MLVAIAIERYFAVIHPLGNKGKLTMGRLKVGLWANTMNVVTGVVSGADL